MKLVTFKTSSGETGPGALLDDLSTIVDLRASFGSVLELIQAGDGGLATAQAAIDAKEVVIPLSAVTLLAPIPNPPRIRDCSVFEDHIKGGAKFFEKMGNAFLAKVPDVWYQQPIYYKGNHLGISGPDSTVVWPTSGKMLDYELELAAVIGKGGKDITTDNALDHLFGFTIFNDLSLRDQAKEIMGLLGPAKAKDFDGGNILGPWLVTKDEIPDINNLVMTASLNGEVQGQGNSSDMYHKWDRIISFASLGETLYPGEVIGSGTVGGGTLIEKGKCLTPGDLVEFSITGLGILRNRIGSQV